MQEGDVAVAQRSAEDVEHHARLAEDEHSVTALQQLCQQRHYKHRFAGGGRPCTILWGHDYRDKCV